MALVLLTAALSAGCSINPATGQRQFNLVGREQEIALGVQATPQFVKDYGGEVPAPKVRQYIVQIGMKMAKLSERPDLPWEFHVLNSPVINAFALPGGKVFITRGLVQKMSNEAQLAGVLGHEIGHVTAQHIGQRMSQQMAISGVAAGLGAAGEVSDRDWLTVLGMGAQAGGSVYLLKFGRDQESEADTLGLRYMTRAGYNPVGQIQVMRILKKEAGGSGGGSGGAEWLSTHPLPETRIERLQQEVHDDYPKARAANNPYTFGKAAFDQNVLEPLKKLPPMKQSQQGRVNDAGDGDDVLARTLVEIQRVPVLLRHPATTPLHLQAGGQDLECGCT
jgi:predicted Zn-dependent protease